jgi:hypothetical protein
VSRICAAVLIQVGATAPALATDAQVVVGDIVIANSKQVTFNATDPKTSPASCAKKSKWAFSLETKKDQEILAQIIVARSIGVPIKIHGNGKCLDLPDAESVDSVGGDGN